MQPNSCATIDKPILSIRCALGSIRLLSLHSILPSIIQTPTTDAALLSSLTTLEQDMLNALNDALAEGKVHTVTCLLQAHPLLVSTRMHAGGWTPLLLASYYDQPKVVEIILGHAGVGVNDVDNDIFRRSALHWLAARGQAVLIFKLVKQHGASVDLRDAENNTPLHRACKANQPMTVMMLLMLGADPEARTEDEEVPAEVTDSSLARAFIRLFQKSCLKSTPVHKGRIGGEMHMAPVSSTSSTSCSCDLSNSKIDERRSLQPQQEHQKQQHGEECLDKISCSSGSSSSSSSSSSSQLRSESPCTRSTASASSWGENQAKEGQEEGKAGMEDETTTLLRGKVAPSGKKNGKRLATTKTLINMFEGDRGRPRSMGGCVGREHQ